MVVAVGNFDGVHRGHAAVIKKACETAALRGEEALVFTFENHPRSFFGEDVKLLLQNDRRKELLLALGVKDVYFQPFDADFAKKAPEEFIALLKEKFDCTAIVCGENFRFGKGAQGKPENIKGIDIFVVVEVDMDGAPVSSTKIRRLINEGNVEEAAALLGRFFSLCGKVVHGKHLGTQLGFPTLNLSVSDSYIMPKNGVYATAVFCEGLLYSGVTNVGVRPSVNDGETLSIETYLLNAKTNLLLYGKDAEVFFLSYLRPEKRFDSLELLTKQINKDCRLAAEIYNKRKLDL